MTNGERHGIFTDDNYGGRKGRAAMDAVMKRYFILSAIYLERRNCVYTDCDATACYDRMIPECTAIHLQSLGLPPPTVKYSVLLNHNMKHHIKTESIRGYCT